MLDGTIDARGGVIISNHADAGVHLVADDFDVPSVHIARDQFSTGDAFAAKLHSTFVENNVDLILLAGYMRKVPPMLIRAWQGKMLNIHPALLPKHGGKGMYGLKVHEAVLNCGDSETGVTIHFVDEEYDRGPILFQHGGVMVEKSDTPETLAEKVLKVEHLAYTKAVSRWIERYSGK